VDIHGFISQGFLKSDKYNYLANDSEKGSFQFNEIGINFGKQVTDKLRIGVQFFARDLGDAANNKITLDWAYGDYRLTDRFGIRAGKIKVPFGLYNETRDMDMLRACIILPQSVYPDLIRDSIIALNGAGVYGAIQMQKAGSLEYQAMTGVMNIDKDSGFGKFIQSFSGGLITLNDDFNTDAGYAGSLRWNTPLTGLALKVSALKTSFDVPATIATVQMDALATIYSLEYVWKDLTLSAEYYVNDTDTSVFGMTTSAKAENYYLMGSYRFSKWLEIGAYYSVNYSDKDDKDGDRYTALGLPDYLAWQKDSALFVRFDINDHFLVKLEGHYVDGAADALAVDNPTRGDKNWYYFAAKATFSF
jgi:hypothetical protein